MILNTLSDACQEASFSDLQLPGKIAWKKLDSYYHSMLFFSVRILLLFAATVGGEISLSLDFYETVTVKARSGGYL